MSASRAAWSIWALSMALTALGTLLGALNGFGIELLIEDAYLNDALIAVSFPTVGALIASRLPRHTIGWLFCGVGLAFALSAFAGPYATYGLQTEPGSLPAATALAWLGGWLWFVGFGALATFLLLLFPSGRLLSRRWRPAGWLAACGIATVVGAIALAPTLVGIGEGVNPLGIGVAEETVLAVGIGGFVLITSSMLCGLTSLALRLRRSRGPERQQLKWFTYSAALMALVSLATLPFQQIALVGLLQAIGQGPVIAAATGIAILRHRLYDIDLVVKRTLVYGALSATLGGSYLVGVVLLQQLFSPFTRGSDLAIAGSTLAVAALFRPARSSIQAAVDKRFYRRRYDARQTLEGFSTRLREQVDLDALGGELQAVVRDTMQPAHAAGGGSGRGA